MKKKIIIFSLLLCCGLILNYASERINPRNITTDSGFDVDYGGGGSYSGSGGWSSGRSYDFDYDRGSRSSRSGSSSSSTSSSEFFFYLFLIILLVWIVDSLFSNKSSNGYISNISSVKGLPKTPEVQAILDEAYDIYLDVQKAWMNFDYNNMRQLVTDELYNMYYNQLQTLNIKGEKNIMSNFKLLNIELMNKKEENGNIYYIVNLTVSFYDYIVNSSNQITRGSDSSMIIMNYSLKYVKSIKTSDRCPNCGGELENGITTCPYCHNRIQGVSSKMKLVSKRVISQR